MQVSREELVESYRQLSDEELLQLLQAGSLTELAQEVAVNELRSRGTVLPARSAAEAARFDGAGESAAYRFGSSTATSGDEDLDLITVRHLSNPLTANLLRACLESHGIYVHLWGEHLGAANIVFSTITGGMRIQVPRIQVAQAEEVITAWERGEMVIGDEPE